LTVFYRASGSATPGIDYSNLTGSVTIAPGKLTNYFLVKPINDLTAEPAETVVVTLLSRPAYKIGSPSTATVTIADDDVSSAGSTLGTPTTESSKQALVASAPPDLVTERLSIHHGDMETRRRIGVISY
jgi:hypothetical protein